MELLDCLIYCKNLLRKVIFFLNFYDYKKWNEIIYSIMKKYFVLKIIDFKI